MTTVYGYDVFLFQILKLYAWEMAFGEKVTAIRDKELAIILKVQLLYCVTIFSWTVAPFSVRHYRILIKKSCLKRLLNFITFAIRL